MELTELAKRPGFGSSGRRIQLIANHFEVKLLSNKIITLTQYHVEITHPRLKLTRDENRVIFWRVVTDNNAVFPSPFAVAFDGSHQCFTMAPIKFPMSDPMYKFEFEIQLAREDRPTAVGVLFQNVGSVAIDLRTVHVAALSDRSMTPIQAIDVILRQGRSNAVIYELAKAWYPFSYSAYKIPEEAGVDLGGGREIWHGLFTSAHVAQGYKPMVNMDVSHTAFIKPINVVDFAIDILNAASGGGYSRKQLHSGVELSDMERKLFEKEIKGLRVRVTHRPGSVREFRVNGVPGSATSMHFDMEDGTRKTVAEYFTERYGPLQFPKFPVLHVGSKRRSAYIPVEHCVLAQNQKAMKKLTERQTSTMIKQAATDAPTRMRKIQTLARDAAFDKDPWLKAFGIQVDMKMVNLDGRMLMPPKIQYAAGNRGGGVVMPRDGAWRFEQERFYVPATANAYGLLVVGRRKDDPVVMQFVSKLIKCCCDFGMRMPQWPDRAEAIGQVADVERAMTAICKDIESKGKQCALMIVVVPQKSTQFYSEIKRVGDVVLGVVTQVALMKSAMDVAQKNKMQTAQNLALKMNMKMGGINSKVLTDQTIYNVVVDQPTMFMGIDVTHPSPLDKRSPSVAAVVSNVDLTPMRFAATIKVQKHRREALVYLVDVMRERLVSFYNATKIKPARIIVYRDGVAEGQFRQVIREELRGLREACLTLSTDYKPPITFIVTQKRHHTRLFCANESDANGRSRNIPPGTVVDNVISSPECFDFYLCSHAGIQGTSRPTRYHVLCDDSKFTSDQLQMITYAMCHMYARCARSVSVPAPSYYADLACTRARYHLLDKVGDFGSDTMSEKSGGQGSHHSAVPEDELVAGATVAESLKFSMYFI